MKYVGMLSGGRMSWAACKRAAQAFGTDNMQLLFCDTKAEDADTYRYLHDCAANIGAPLVIVADGRTIWETFRDARCIGNSRMDVCSRVLKREVAARWLRKKLRSGGHDDRSRFSRRRETTT